MYEKDIHALQSIRPMPQETCKVAIELMRAAEPKDEAAEREHCEASRIVRVPADMDLLMRERAAARAEGYALGYDHGFIRNLSARANGDQLTQELILKLTERAEAAERECARLGTVLRPHISSACIRSVIETLLTRPRENGE